MSFKKKYKQVIDFYGGREQVEIIARAVQKEKLIFRTAVTYANYTIDPKMIIRDITLLDVICELHKKLEKLVGDDKYIYSRKEDYRNYCSCIWELYCKNGGNYHVIIYGIMEYLCSMYDPTCYKMENNVKQLLSDTSFRSEVLLHKIEAGF